MGHAMISQHVIYKSCLGNWIILLLSAVSDVYKEI